MSRNPRIDNRRSLHIISFISIPYRKNMTLLFLFLNDAKIYLEHPLVC